MNENDRAFVWDNAERYRQEAAYTQINEIAEEYEMETFFCGCEQFADLCEKHNIDPSEFTVEQYNQWKQWVAEDVVNVMMETENKVFKELVYDIGGKIKKKFDNSNK